SEPGGYVLATVHRAENTDDPRRLTAIIEGLKLLSRELPVVLPLHPRTARASPGLRRDVAEEFPGFKILEPVGYLDMLALERSALCVVTDSGGVQKEAFFHRVPCVTLRDETEWVELVEAGWNRLCPPGDPEDLVRAVRTAMSRVPDEAPLFYGNGRSSERIVDSLLGL
ncbi:MAG: UDP-N-acetylglucosamine 2-epimerase, partial [Desulfotignum sp.]|nr:UDP-N-acetylglucosamine 2-epimerase [Desulfotignum sp.]